LSTIPKIPAGIFSLMKASDIDVEYPVVFNDTVF